MQKAFVKKNPPWVNYPDISTPIIADELNRVETGIDTIDDRVVAFDTSKANQNDLLVTFKAVSFNSTTGVFTFTKWNDTTVTVDTDIEKIAVNFDYDDDPTSAHYQSLVLTLSDGTIKYVDLSALITEYEFTDSSTIAFTVASSGAVSASVINGSITADKLQPNYLADITTQANNASASATSAGNSKLDAEAWANGTRNGTAVESTDPAYHNNSKYWKDQAQQIASGSIGGLSDVSIDSVTLANGQVLVYNTTTQMWENKTPIDVGIFPHLIIISDTGSVVTATKGSTVITAVETSTGVFECDVTEFGTWVIDAILSGDDAQISVNVDIVKVYTIDDRHFHADITVTYPNEETDIVSLTDGVTTFYATSSPYTFTVHNSGSWVLNRSVNGIDVYTKTFSVTTSGQTFSDDIPELLTMKGVQNVLDNHRESSLLTVGDEVNITINSNPWTMLLGGINLYGSHEVIFVSKYLWDSTSYWRATEHADESYADVDIRRNVQAIYEQISADDKAYIKLMTKTGGIIRQNGFASFSDYLWIPNAFECDGSTRQDSNNPKVQFSIFTTASNRIKSKNGGSNLGWWTCDAVTNSVRSFLIDTSGATQQNLITAQYGILPCFKMTADS